MVEKSIVDYIFRWLGSRFLSTEEKATLGLIDRSAIDAPAAEASPLAAAPTVSTSTPFTTGHSATSASGGSTSSPGAQPDASEAVAPPTASEATHSSVKGTVPEAASDQQPQGSAGSEAAPREDLKVLATNAHANGHAANGNGSASSPVGGSGGSGTGAITMSLGATKVSFQTQADAPSCAECGSIMVRNGSCYKCLNCGSTSGCS